MIFHDHKTIFFHIGKTAGTSVEILLGCTDEPVDIANFDIFYGYDPKLNIYLQHVTPVFIKSRIDEQIFNSYFKFSVVRNPFIRSLSVYHYLIEQHTKEFGSFENYIRSLPRLIEQGRSLNSSHHLPQTSYTHIDGDCVCDYIAHFERLPDSLEPVRKKLGITQTLGQHNSHRYHDWSTQPPERHFTNEMVEIMVDVYSNDFSELGYSQDLKYLDPIATPRLEIDTN